MALRPGATESKQNFGITEGPVAALFFVDSVYEFIQELQAQYKKDRRIFVDYAGVASVFLGVADFFGAAAFFAGAFLVEAFFGAAAAFVFVTRPDFVLPITFGSSTTAGA